MKKFLESLSDMFQSKDSGIFRQIPLNVPGGLFTSPMPYGAYDPSNRLMKVFKKHHIDHVIMLVTDRELEKKARRNIMKEYEKNGIGYSRFIINDFQAPSVEVIDGLVKEAINRLNNNERILIHCHAGVGRTSVSASCVTIAVENMSAEEAIKHVKANMMVNITSEQIRLIKKFEESLQSTK